MTAIDRFVQVAQSPDTSGNQAIDCCGDELSYSQLFAIVYGIAQELRNKFGNRPIVAIVCENTPYTLATILATWLLGGIAAPLDVHAPETLLKGMLEGVRPTCVVLPDTASGNIKLVQGELGAESWQKRPVLTLCMSRRCWLCRLSVHMFGFGNSVSPEEVRKGCNRCHRSR